MIKKGVIIILILIFSKSLYAQYSVRDSSINAVLVGIGGGIYVPGGDLARRFGLNENVHLSCGLKRESNWIFSIDGDYILGGDVKQPDLFKNISTHDGYIIGNDGKFATVRTFERGYIITFNIAKLIAIGKPNKNSGFIFRAGAGFMQHKIKIDPVGNTVPFLDKEYQKGYDRLTNGIAFHQFAGYQYMGNSRAVNFFAGFDFYEGLMQSRRSYNYDEMKKDSAKRSDIMIGLKIGWMLPLYRQAPSAYYLN